MDEQEWKALARIARSPEGRKVLGWLSRKQEESRRQLEQEPEHSQLMRLQGSIKARGELIDAIEQAPDVVQKRFTK